MGGVKLLLIKIKKKDQDDEKFLFSYFLSHKK